MTLVWLGSGVDGLVHFHFVGQLEAPAADPAPVGFVPRVNPHMRGEGAGLGEGLAALATFVGPVPRVSPEVRREVTRQGEGLDAQVALEGLLTRVHTRVGSQVARLGEGLAADVAGVGFLGVVAAPVDRQVGEVVEGDVAVVALVEAAGERAVVRGDVVAPLLLGAILHCQFRLHLNTLQHRIPFQNPDRKPHKIYPNRNITNCVSTM